MKLLHRRQGEHVGEAQAAQVVGPREADVVVHDVDEHWRVEPRAVEGAEHQREVRALGLPGWLELIAERDARRRMRAAHRDLPFAACGRRLAAGLERLAELRARFLEGETPVV